MKLRMLILAVAVMAFATTGFGQGGQFIFSYIDGTTPGWMPLTYDCNDPTSPLLEDGTVVRIMVDPTFNGYDAADPPATVGADGGAGQISPTNEFQFNSADILENQGSFSQTSFTFQYLGGVPAFQALYLLIGCYLEDGSFSPMYYSHGFTPGQGYTELIVTCPVGGVPIPRACWTCVGSCEPPAQGCTASEPLHIPTQPGGHGDVDDPNQYFCVQLCAGEDFQIEVGPLADDEYPVVQVFEGCDLGVDGCNDPDCPAATGFFDPLGWIFDPSRGVFTNWIIVNSDGCACICLDDILSAQLLGFTATPRDREVELAWSTASETDVSAFEIKRDGALVHSVNSANVNGASYTWTDTDRANGRTYTYELVQVNVNDSREVIATTDATPLANLAVITEYALHQNYPNPFNPTTNIVFDLVENNFVELTVYNAVGQKVSTLVNGSLTSGRHNVEFSSDNLTSGIYFYSVKIGNEFTATKKMLLVK